MARTPQSGGSASLGSWPIPGKSRIYRGENRHRPSYWLENQQAVELVRLLETAGIPVVSLEGRNGGTYAVKELVKTGKPPALRKKPAGFLLGSRAPPCRERPTVSKPARCRNSGISGACRPEPPGRGCRRRPTLPQRRIAGRPRGLLRKFRNIRKPPIRRFQTCLRDGDTLSRNSCFALPGGPPVGTCRPKHPPRGTNLSSCRIPPHAALVPGGGL